MTVRRLFLVLVLVVGVLGVAACSGEPAKPAAGAEAPPPTLSTKGDPAKGKVVFEGSGGCAACHLITTEKLVGPGLANTFGPGGPKLPDGVDYGGKLPNGKERSDENVAEWIRVGGQGKIGLMSAREMSDTDMADLLAYLRTLK